MAIVVPTGAPGILAPVSQHTAYVQSFDPDLEKQIRQIDNNSTTKNPNTELKKVRVEPITAQQPNTTPTTDPDSGTFDTDGFRYGVPGADSEIANPRTLDASGNEDELASMTLRIPGKPFTNQITGNTFDEGGTDIISAYSRFFLQSVSEAEQEKYQIVETFTGFYAFFYGKRPPIYRYSGLLLSDGNYRWHNDFKFVYENYFRGTRATEFTAEVIMQYDGRLITGFPLGLAMQQDAVNDKGVPFTMDMLVVSHTPLVFSKDISALLTTKRNELATARNNMTAYIERLKSAGGPAVRATDRATNSLAAPVSVSTPNTTFRSPISQLAP